MTELPHDLMPKAITVRLLETASGNLVAASLRSEVSVEDLERIESLWSPARLAAVEAIAAQGRNAQHRHWDWAAKSPLVANNECAGLIVELDGIPQGVLLYSLTPTAPRLNATGHLPVLYVQFVEVAPWNTLSLATEPRYKAVGTTLLYGASAISRSKGWDGRIGLHALPQAEVFYERLGMTRFEPELEHEGLTYFELSSKGADDWKFSE